jgi:hypothetical protein
MVTCPKVQSGLLSWGPAWGENGYMRIAYGTSLVGEDATYVVYGETAPAAPTAMPPLLAGPITKVYLPLVLRYVTPRRPEPRILPLPW